ncbi:hypothetical protein Hypma_014231 [Hypsizygus marmoreus]|uniref:Uncharacterized protein n=1 Tax=Hypsizygus marmoreus TaxID=39966 RepID=A0A369JHC9_HYPMA|nr:hypothetical protein Hypma_014231 [Hypsizygus marmoreus]
MAVFREHHPGHPAQRVLSPDPLEPENDSLPPQMSLLFLDISVLFHLLPPCPALSCWRWSNMHVNWTFSACNEAGVEGSRASGAGASWHGLRRSRGKVTRMGRDSRVDVGNRGEMMLGSLHILRPPRRLYQAACVCVCDGWFFQA